MINKEILIGTINAFQEKFEAVKVECKKYSNGQPCHLEYFKMTEAWRKLQNVIELEILPYVEETN